MADLTITVSGDALLGYTIILEELYELNTIIRRDTTGHYPDVVVRGADKVAAVGSTITVIDYEAPLNLSFIYVAQGFFLATPNVPTTQVNSEDQRTTVPVGFGIIASVLDTAERVAGVVLDFAEYSQSTSIIARHKILGRAKPVLVTDLLAGREGTITMSNFDAMEVRYDVPGSYAPHTVVPGRWNTIFADADVLFFRSDYRATGFDDCYFVCESVAAKRLLRVGQMEDALMSYAIRFVEVDRPLTALEGLGLFTYQTLTDHNNTYADLTAKFATYQNITLNPTL